jgi:siroheme synthase-like protein
MGYYPICLDVSGWRCIVIGGGAVAVRRVESLLSAGGKVSVVSPVVIDGLARLIARDAVKHVPRCYQAGDLAGARLAMVAIGDRDVSRSIFAEARARGVLVNAADDPAHCDFVLPAVVRRGDLSVAVSTGGVSPATARAIREELESYFTEDYARLVQIAGEVRQELKNRSRPATAGAWNRALRGQLRQLIADDKSEEAKRLLRRLLGDYS